MTCTQDTRPTARHTPEPWEYAESGLIYGQCGEDDDEAPFVCDVIEDIAMQAFGMLSPVEEANARRICAAINACEGISTPALEQGVVAELLEAIPRLIGLVHRLLPRHAQSDSSLDHIPEVIQARAAIAKATAIHNQPERSHQ